MKQLFFLVSLILSFWSVAAFSQELSCQQIHYIQKRFLKHHISHTKLSNSLQDRVLNQFIKILDREKVYFLKSDIQSIKRKNKRLFSNLKKQKCPGLYYIYDTYAKRVKERVAFANTYLNKNFKLRKKAKYVLDKDLKKFPKSTKEANKKMETYLQFQVANVSLFEKDLKKAVEQVSYIVNNQEKQVLSWKPRLNQRELRECRTKSHRGFQVCKPTKWFSNYLDAYSQSLDSHSSYMDNEDLEDFYISMNLELEGIGATLGSSFGYTVVERLIPGGAAAKSKKIKAKDKIVAVGQTKDHLVNIFGERIEDVVSIIRGPKGTPVFLKIVRKEKDGTVKNLMVKLIRDRVDLKEEEASITFHKIKVNGLNQKIGLLKVPSFYGSNGFGKSVTKDSKKLLKQAKKEKIDALVLDLSNNRGGALDEAVELSGLFFARGNVVKQTEKYSKKPHILRDRDKRIFYSGPLVVLVNRLSASASEIVSGALQDYNRAVIVGGDHTFGKGSVQSVEPLFSKLGALKTTVGLYFIPSGKSTQKEGVSSDIVLPSIFNREELGEKTLDYVLPKKVIQSFKSSPQEIFSKDQNNWKPVDQKLIVKLKDNSKKRVAKNKKFQDIQKDLKEIKDRVKNQKVITVAEILKNKDKDKEELEKLGSGELSDTEKEKNYLERADIQEALNIAGDFALFQQTVQTRKKQKAL